MSREINPPKLIRATLYPVYLITKYLGATSAGIANMVIFSRPVRYLAEKLRPDIPQPESVPCFQRFRDGSNLVLEALRTF